MNNIARSIVTMGPIGYMPAPGTWATVSGVVLFYGLMGVTHSLIVYTVCMLTLMYGGWHAIRMALPMFASHDPRQIVIDELVGYMVALWAVPFSWPTIVVSVGLFRFLDIVKPCGIKQCEKISGATGIMLDDLVAGLVTNLIMHIGLYIGLL